MYRLLGFQRLSFAKYKTAHIVMHLLQQQVTGAHMLEP